MSHGGEQPSAPEVPAGTAPEPAAPPLRARSTWWALAAVLAATIWFRSPILVNAGSVNSDAAVVGLQARHMLHGEWSPFLWGAGYQSSIEAVIAAAIFLVAGATPLALMLVPLLGHLLATWFAYDVVRKRTSPWRAALLVAPIVLVPMPVNTILLNVARSWSVTAVFASAWLIDGAARSRRPLVRFAAGCYLGLIAVYLDLFSLVFLPGLAILALAATRDESPRRRVWLERLAACGGGVLAGIVCLWIIRSAGGASSTEATLTTRLLAHNFELLAESCLPWVLGTKTFLPSGGLYPTLWAPPAAYAWVPLAAACSLALLLGTSVITAFARARADWQVSRVGVFGLTVVGSTVAAFLISTKPEDVWSARYLAPVVLAAPFALAPAYRRLGRWFLVLVLPYLVSSAVSGWRAYGDWVAGPFPARTAVQTDRDVAALRDLLRQRGVRYGVAQYWLAYRLSFLFGEDPVLVPFDPAEDRYAPYRDGVVAAKAVAFVFHPSEPRARPEPVEATLRQNGTPFERLAVGGFTVLLAARTGSP